MTKPLSIVEIGDKPFIKTTFPRETTYFCTTFVPAPAEPEKVLEGPLPPEQFCRCASAWLARLPKGYGWKCFRRYEASVFAPLPVCNRPPLERHKPLREGERTAYYSVESGGLAQTVTAALADKARLARMAEAGRAFVLADHTPAALGADIVDETLRTAGQAE